MASTNALWKADNLQVHLSMNHRVEKPLSFAVELVPRTKIENIRRLDG